MRLRPVALGTKGLHYKIYTITHGCSHMWNSLLVISSESLEEKSHIYAPPCIIILSLNIYSQQDFPAAGNGF